ncbi:hypothetical protein [Nonomuraea sp. NPDC003201]
MTDLSVLVADKEDLKISIQNIRITPQNGTFGQEAQKVTYPRIEHSVERGVVGSHAAKIRSRPDPAWRSRGVKGPGRRDGPSSRP